MIDRTIGFIKYAAKAVIAAVTPLVTLFISELVTDLETLASQAGAAAVGAVLAAFGVFWTRNAPTP